MQQNLINTDYTHFSSAILYKVGANYFKTEENFKKCLLFMLEVKIWMHNAKYETHAFFLAI